MRRRRGSRRPPVVARDGDLVVDARVRARLLGISLLDLDARIVVGNAGDERERAPATPAPVAATARAHPSDGDGDGDDGGAAGPAPRPALSRAVRLLGEGESALDEARRIRLRARPARDGTRTPR